MNDRIKQADDAIEERALNRIAQDMASIVIGREPDLETYPGVKCPHCGHAGREEEFEFTNRCQTTGNWYCLCPNPGCAASIEAPCLEDVRICEICDEEVRNPWSHDNGRCVGGEE